MQEFGVNYVDSQQRTKEGTMDLSAHTHPVCETCVCARSGSRCIHTGRRHQRLTEGMSEA